MNGGARDPWLRLAAALALSFGPEEIPVDVTTPAGTAPSVLRIPPVQPGPLRVFAPTRLPTGAEVRRRDGTLLGAVEPSAVPSRS